MFSICFKSVCLSILTTFSAMTVLAANPAPSPATATSSEAVVQIAGMTCGGCEGTVTEKVSASPVLKDKIESCAADAKAGTAKIKFKPGMSMSQTELEAAVGQALKETTYTVAGPTPKKATQKK